MHVEEGSFAVCLLLCGLPGSGKSMFVREVSSAAAASGQENAGRQRDDTLLVLSSKFDQIDSIEYDKVARYELGQQQRSNGGEEFDSNDLEAWRKSRTKALEILTQKLDAHFTTDESNNNNSTSLLVMLDDNFHLRSMRRDVYRTCQNVIKQQYALDGRIPKIGFCAVYFDTPLETCLERNSSRIGKECIPEDVVVRMAASVEPPDETKPNASFERRHVTIDNSSGDQDPGRYIDVIKCICESIGDPVKPKSELSPEEQEQRKQDLLREREATRRNVTQQSDLLLRRLVGAVGRVEKNRSKDANATRKLIMDDVKSGDAIGDLTLEGIALRFASAVTGNKLNHWSDSHETPLLKAIHTSFNEFEDSRR